MDGKLDGEASGRGEASLSVRYIADHGAGRRSIQRSQAIKLSLHAVAVAVGGRLKTEIVMLQGDKFSRKGLARPVRRCIAGIPFVTSGAARVSALEAGSLVGIK